MRRTGIALVILTVLAFPCVVQTPPEWSGYYTLASGKDLGKLQAVEPVTAEDPKALAKPYTYTRYYEKLDTDIMEDVCEE